MVISLWENPTNGRVSDEVLCPPPIYFLPTSSQEPSLLAELLAGADLQAPGVLFAEIPLQAPGLPCR